MTEELWLTSPSAATLLSIAERRLSVRKFGLVHTACCRVATSGWDPNHPLCVFIPSVEAILDGDVSDSDANVCLANLRRWIRDSSQLLMELLQETRGKLRKNVLELGHETAAAYLLSPVVDVEDRWWRTETTIDDELLYAHCTLVEGAREVMLNDNIPLLRDIFGNPFRPVTFAPAWRTSAAMALASQMYESRDFAHMPILADALEDAGCDSDEVLKHCRDEKATHVRGCWVIDLVLGKS